MSKLLWKIDYTIHLRKLTTLSYSYCWNAAGAFIESFPDEWKYATPQEAAEFEIDELVQSKN